MLGALWHTGLPSAGRASRQLAGNDESSSSSKGYAAADLANRAGVTVRLDSSAGWGVTVTVDIPGDLMVRRPITPTDPHRPRPRHHRHGILPPCSRM